MERNYSSYKDGDDIDGVKIKSIILLRPDAMLFEDINGVLRWSTTNPSINERICDAISAYSIIINAVKDKNVQNDIYKNCLRTAIAKNSEMAIEYLQKAVAFQLTELHLSLKTNYLLKCLALTAAIGCFAFILFLINIYIPSSEVARMFQLIGYLSSGALGGFASVYSGLSKLSTEHLSNHFNSTINSISRIFLAMSFGLLAAITLKTGMVLGPLFINDHASIYLFCVAAGFSESLVPNLLNKAADTTT